MLASRAPSSRGASGVLVANDPQGKRPDWWPREPAGYVFLAHAVEKIGAALHEDWTGEEAATKDIDLLPHNLKAATYLDRQQADILLSDFRPDLCLLDFLAGQGSREFSEEDWKTARERAQHLHNQRRPALDRLKATQSEIVKRNETGELELRIHPRSGGPWRDFQRDWWNTDKWRSHFDRGLIDPDYPNGRPSWNREDNDHWIFTTSQSIESVKKLLTRVSGKDPSGKPASNADLTNFMEKYEGARTEGALAEAMKNAGMNVTRTRIRALLPAGRKRGRPNKSPK
jgi:hypothetical protein